MCIFAQLFIKNRVSKYMRRINTIIRLAAAASILAVAFLTGSCGGAKLATANEQLASGEYHDAARTYRIIYNNLTKI